MRRAYQTDLSDAEWSHIEPLVPAPKAPGRPRVHTLREILNAIFYIVRSGCGWRLLPHDFPPWKTVHHYFRTWRIDGTWERMHAADTCFLARNEAKDAMDAHAKQNYHPMPRRSPGAPVAAAGGGRIARG